MFSGVTFGGGLPGIVAAKFMGTYGWQVLFWVGGIAPILVAVLVYFTLPESIKFLSLRRERHPEFVRILAVMQPGLTLDPNSSWASQSERQFPRAVSKSDDKDRAMVTCTLYGSP